MDWRIQPSSVRAIFIALITETWRRELSGTRLEKGTEEQNKSAGRDRNWLDVHGSSPE